MVAFDAWIHLISDSSRFPYGGAETLFRTGAFGSLLVFAGLRNARSEKLILLRDMMKRLVGSLNDARTVMRLVELPHAIAHLRRLKYPLTVFPVVQSAAVLLYAPGELLYYICVVLLAWDGSKRLSLLSLSLTVDDLSRISAFGWLLLVLCECAQAWTPFLSSGGEHVIFPSYFWRSQCKLLCDGLLAYHWSVDCPFSVSQVALLGLLGSLCAMSSQLSQYGVL